MKIKEQYCLGKPLAANIFFWKRKHTDEMLVDSRKEKYFKYSSGYFSYIYYNNCMVKVEKKLIQILFIFIMWF